MKRVGLYFFVVASLLSIVDGSFQTTSVNLYIAKSILLVFSGVFIGLFLMSEERNFLLSAFAFVVSGSILTNLLGSFFEYSPFGKILSNFILVFAAAVVTVGFKEVVGSITKAAGIQDTLHSEIEPAHLDKSSFESVWGIVILVAVCVAILQLLLQTFYDLSAYTTFFDFLDLSITALFIVDVIILYEKAESIKQFFKRNIFDILSAVPAIGFLRAFKIIRAARIIKIFNRSAKLSHVLKVSRSTKFFSENSSMAVHTGGKKNKSVSVKKKETKKKETKKKPSKNKKVNKKKKSTKKR